MGNEKSGTDRTKTADASGGHADLDRQYGNIGISAVAAALPYVENAKNPSTRKEDRRRSEKRTRSILKV
jgi:hypothetical protein